MIKLDEITNPYYYFVQYPIDYRERKQEAFFFDVLNIIYQTEDSLFYSRGFRSTIKDYEQTIRGEVGGEGNALSILNLFVARVDMLDIYDKIKELNESRDNNPFIDMSNIVFDKESGGLTVRFRVIENGSVLFTAENTQLPVRIL